MNTDTISRFTDNLYQGWKGKALACTPTFPSLYLPLYTPSAREVSHWEVNLEMADAQLPG